MQNYRSFPFLGAGLASYYEFCEIIILFINKPDKDEKRRIIKLAPIPIKPEKDDFHNFILATCSDQFVNKYIEETYGNYTSTDEDSFFYVSTNAIKAFEQDIERWLHNIHAICPIEIAYRPEDWEAGGTELSD